MKTKSVPLQYSTYYKGGTQEPLTYRSGIFVPYTVNIIVLYPRVAC